ncbi:MAG: cyclase family protein [Rhizobiaceae bacterium]|nr:cyclase family protein [Rhizobiaceae bacterium]
MQLIDLSVALDNDVEADPPMARPKINYLGHRETFDRLGQHFPDLRPENLPDGEAWAIEKVELTTHNGTHLDAPWHFHSTTNHALVPGGEKSRTIDEIPLEWCMRPGVKLDFRDRDDGHVVSANEVEAELKRIGHHLNPFDIVVINTRAGERYGHSDYVSAGCGMSREATLWLLERGVRITGTDGWSWDAPFVHTAQRVAETGDTSLVWEGHKAGREREYCHLEKLHNLEQLPDSGFTMICFPVKLKQASAGWVRAVAML